MPQEDRLENRLAALITGRRDVILENKIFNTAAFVFFLLSAIIGISSVFSDSSLWVIISLLSISVVFLFIFYNARYKEQFLISSRLFVLFTLIFNDVAWCWSVAQTPAANYFFVLIVVLDLTILKVKDHVGFIIVAALNLFLIDFLAFTYPHFFLNHYELMKDLTFPMTGHVRLASLIILIAVVLTFFKKNYEREREVSNLRSRQLLNNNAALKHRNEHLESMARMVSHNLRSPMAGLKMVLRLLKRVETQEEKEELMESFHEGADALFNMIDDLSVIMLDYRELVKEQESIELAKTLRHVQKQLATQIKESGAIIEADFSAYPVVFYSRYFLESIFLNLITNAIKYRSELRPLRLKIRSYLASEKVMLSFADNGIGIDLQENGDKVFNMYKTFHNRPEIDSKGIGLFMTKNQVEMMGGKIEVISAPERGATFFLELYRL